MKACILGITLAILVPHVKSGVTHKPQSLLRKKASARALRVLPPYPLDRFQAWSSLNEATKTGVSGVLGYTEESWNIPGENPIEELSFETLGFQMQVEKQFFPQNERLGAIMTLINITDEDVWDCHINHYVDYSWDEMVNFTLVSYLEDLGWTRDSYESESESAPPSEDKGWYELTDSERMAAEALCYFPELWAGDIEIAEWEYQPPVIVTDNSAESSNVTVVERPEIFPWTLPVARLTVWDQLNPVQQGYATTIGYNSSTWNNPGTSVIETNYTSFGDLTPAGRAAAESLGIDEFFWDCLIQHYANYGWDQLEALGVKGYFETLGWNYASWHYFIPPPATDTMAYSTLTPEQQSAADQLCYLPETYNIGSDLSFINLQSLTAPPTAPPSMLASVP